MNIWIDDIRPAPDESYLAVKSVNKALDVIEECFYSYIYDMVCEPIVIDLDHDAGDYEKYGGDYFCILVALERNCNEHQEWRDYMDQYVTFRIHSMNPVGRMNMERIIKKNGWEYKR